MSLKVIKRSDNGRLQIVGTIYRPDGSKQFIRQAPVAQTLRGAKEEAAGIEAKSSRIAWHGQPRGARPFADAVESYLDSSQRAEGDRQRLIRIVEALGKDTSLAEITQEAINRVKAKILRPNAAPGTIGRGLIVPVRAVMYHAYRLGWCDPPNFERQKKIEGRVLYMTPAEVRRLIMAAAPHIKPLLIFLVGTGARMSEAIELEWRDVDLVGGRVTFWRTKTKKVRRPTLPPVVVQTLRELAERYEPKIGTQPVGRVFRWQTVTPKRRGKAAPAIRDYVDRGRETGGQIRTAWAGAIRRAGLDPELHPHDCRHTWASWHYAVHKDPLELKVEGGWASLVQVERYAHLLPAGQEDEIRAFLAGGEQTQAVLDPARRVAGV